MITNIKCIIEEHKYCNLMHLYHGSFLGNIALRINEWRKAYGFEFFLFRFTYISYWYCFGYERVFVRLFTRICRFRH